MLTFSASHQNRPGNKGTWYRTRTSNRTTMHNVLQHIYARRVEQQNPMGAACGRASTPRCNSCRLAVLHRPRRFLKKTLEPNCAIEIATRILGWSNRNRRTQFDISSGKNLCPQWNFLPTVKVGLSSGLLTWRAGNQPSNTGSTLSVGRGSEMCAPK
jgi:hypothetical protein